MDALKKLIGAIASVPAEANQFNPLNRPMARVKEGIGDLLRGGKRPNPWPDTGWDSWADKQLPYLQAPQLRGYAPQYSSNIPPMPPAQLPPPRTPQFNLISASHGGLQPFGGGYEDEVSPQQALQPTGYSNQTSLHGNLTQGPLSSFYKLRGY
jgi:hypothetical protein